ncbi:hypothetical protein QVD17_13448 [Tagetes erecta]|uniref:DUF4005 domain-containing protein n=1 Tax=Tagetes erecta TaxID=13708 RepID=A0AAD8NW63_TARER|nr:hypothetical protein QVD17_13448 [Tagetes erecta]
MGKATRFFKSLLGFKTMDSQSSRSKPNKQLKRRWSFITSRTPHGPNTYNHRDFEEDEDPSNHAIALAAATAAVVDAAVATAHAAAEVVRMTTRTTGYGGREKLAAIKIQSCFRAYLARRALRALKALVKLQAVVRGHILRKQTTDMMRRLQALMRAQTLARALRSQISDSTAKPSHFHHQGPPTPEKREHFPHTKRDNSSISKRNNSKSYARGQERTFLDTSTDHEHDKIVEVDTGEHHVISKFGYSQSLTTSRGSTFHPTSSSPCASCEVSSFDDLVKGSVSTPIKSDGSRSCFSGYSDHPNYMSNTESSRAKVRSLSAPRMRSQLEASSAIKRDSGQKYVSVTQQDPTMRESFTKKAYPGSGRLDRLGMPVYDTIESDYCVSYWN